MNDDPPIRVALLGYGYAGRTFHAPLLAAEPGLALAAVASSKPDLVRSDLPGMTVHSDPLLAATSADIDLVVVATSNDSHASLARAALKAGKHVVVDKPFTLELGEARALAALAEERDRLLSVFQNRRWDSDFVTVRDAIENGMIGEVTQFETHFDRFRPETRDRWRERDAPGGGVWFDLGPHMVDQTMLLFGVPDSVQANFAIQRRRGAAHDWAHIVLNYGERRMLLHADMSTAGGSNRFIVHGDRGSIIKARIDQQEAQLLAGMRPGEEGWGRDDDPLQIYDGHGQLRSAPASSGDQRLYYAGVARAVKGIGVNPVTPAQAVTVMAVIEAGIASARADATIPLTFADEERAAWM